MVTVPLYEAKAELLRTLGHPARIRVLELLSERDHAVHELLAEIDLEPSNLSQHLAVLRHAGLVHQSRSLSSSRTRIRAGWPRVLSSSAFASYRGTVTMHPPSRIRPDDLRTC